MWDSNGDGSSVLFLRNEYMISLNKNGIIYVFDSPKGLFYRIIKEFKKKKYLDILDPSDRIALCRFRTCDNRLPIEVGRSHRKIPKKTYAV
jgi:hypothetical protein